MANLKHSSYTSTEHKKQKQKRTSNDDVGAIGAVSDGTGASGFLCQNKVAFQNNILSPNADSIRFNIRDEYCKIGNLPETVDANLHLLADGSVSFTNSSGGYRGSKDDVKGNKIKEKNGVSKLGQRNIRLGLKMMGFLFGYKNMFTLTFRESYAPSEIQAKYVLELILQRFKDTYLHLDNRNRRFTKSSYVAKKLIDCEYLPHITPDTVDTYVDTSKEHQYYWTYVPERQKNGVIHYHLVMPYFIPYKVLNLMVNECYLQVFTNPPPDKKLKSLKRYEDAGIPMEWVQLSQTEKLQLEKEIELIRSNKIMNIGGNAVDDNTKVCIYPNIQNVNDISTYIFKPTDGEGFGVTKKYKNVADYLCKSESKEGFYGNTYGRSKGLIKLSSKVTKYLGAYDRIEFDNYINQMVNEFNVRECHTITYNTYNTEIIGLKVYGATDDDLYEIEAMLPEQKVIDSFGRFINSVEVIPEPEKAPEQAPDDNSKQLDIFDDTDDISDADGTNDDNDDDDTSDAEIAPDDIEQAPEQAPKITPTSVAPDDVAAICDDIIVVEQIFKPP